MDKLNQLKQAIEQIQTKSLVASDMKAFITLVLSVIKKYKDELETLSIENKQIIQEAINYIEKESNNLKNNLTKETEKAKKDFDLVLKEANDFLKEVKKIKTTKGENGKDGEDGYTPIKGKDYFTKREIQDVKKEILKEIPPQEEILGEEIVKKINDLPIEEDKQIDAKHIKGLEKFISKSKSMLVGGIRFLSQLLDVQLTNIQNGDILAWDDTNKVWINTTVRRVASPASSASYTLDIDSYDCYTIASTEGAGTLTLATTGTPTNFQKLQIKISATAAQTFSWNAVFAGTTDVALSTSIGANKKIEFGFEYHTDVSKWELLAITQII